MLHWKPDGVVIRPGLNVYISLKKVLFLWYKDKHTHGIVWRWTIRHSVEKVVFQKSISGDNV